MLGKSIVTLMYHKNGSLLLFFFFFFFFFGGGGGGGSVIKPNVVGAILLCSKYNLVKIFQNECSKSWYMYNTCCSATAKL